MGGGGILISKYLRSAKTRGNSYNVLSGPSQISLKTALEPKKFGACGTKMPFLAFSERLAALCPKNFAPVARKLLVLGQSVEVPGKLSQAAQKSRKQGGGEFL